ncbi:cupredoxin domain-containing protein [Wenyingzhuangia sp. IMCC45574]
MKHCLKLVTLTVTLFICLLTTNCGDKTPIATFTVDAVTNKDYIIESEGLAKAKNPTLTLKRGETYVFNVVAYNHPFFIKTEKTAGKDNSYDDGVTNNGTSESTILFSVPKDAPETLYYVCRYHEMMAGEIKIID